MGNYFKYGNFHVESNITYFTDIDCFAFSLNL